VTIVANVMGYVAGLKPSTEIDSRDQMYGHHDQHYFGVGRSAILIILSALTARLSYAGGDSPVRTILDFGGGHGRVARYLRASFPESRVEVTDFNRPGVEFCVKSLGCYDMGADVPTDHYDLIWVGSVFTHLPAQTAIILLANLKGALRKGGVLVLTTGGRLGLNALEGFVTGLTGPSYTGYGLTLDGAAALISEYRATGHGYHDYPQQKGYGGALLRPDWMFNHALDERTVQIMFQEMGWDTHQDVYAFMNIDADQIHKVGRGPYFF
jgi:SAM-dependent methyltransferase